MATSTTNSTPAGAQKIGTLPGGQTAFVGGTTAPAPAVAAPTTAPTRGSNGTLYQSTDQTSAAVASRSNPNLPGAPIAGAVTAKTPVISTADPSYSAVNSLGQSIATAKSNPITVPGILTNPGANNLAGYDTTAAKDASDAYIANLEARKKELAAERDAEVSRISGDWSKQVDDLKATETAETGTTGRNLTYLQQGGQSASAQAYLNSLEKTHTGEVTTMLAKRDNALAVAEQAYSDKNFQLSDKMMQEAKDLEKTIYDRNNQYLDNTLKIRQDQRSQLEFEQKTQDAAKTFAMDNGISQQFYDVGGVVYRTSDGKAFGDAQSFVAAGGDPNYKNVFVVVPGSKEAKAYVQDLAGKYPDAGISLKDDPATAQAKIKSSAIYREQVRPPSSGGGSSLTYDQQKDLTLQKDIATVNNNLASAAGKDGYVNVKDWKRAYDDWVSAGYKGQDFVNNNNGYVNPKSIDPYFGVIKVK